VPISIKPKSKLPNWLKAMAFLSKPAAKPVGFLKSKPKTVFFSFGLFT
jgi:hypothetical protein